MKLRDVHFQQCVGWRGIMFTAKQTGPDSVESKLIENRLLANLHSPAIGQRLNDLRVTVFIKEVSAGQSHISRTRGGQGCVKGCEADSDSG